MKINYFRRHRKSPLLQDKQRENNTLEGSSSWDFRLDTGLTNRQTDDKMESEKEILTFDREGSLNKVPESKMKKKALPKKSLDLKYLNIGYYILVPIIGGVGLGVFLDNYFHTKSIFIGIFLFLGTVAGFYNLIKLLKE